MQNRPELDRVPSLHKSKKSTNLNEEFKVAIREDLAKPGVKVSILYKFAVAIKSNPAAAAELAEKAKAEEQARKLLRAQSALEIAAVEKAEHHLLRTKSAP